MTPLTLPPGTRLGPYEILSALGVGGMGEVYRATDTNLKRQVAIKVLPQTLAADSDRLARFQREAEVLAALNHPNIAHIHGLERSDGTIALVMELVEGPTLADRIAQGAIPLDEALPIAKQIAEALEAAHEQGIIHRDLKPANIKVREDGTVKVLDFGLAKAMDPVGASSANASMSPTMSMHATRAGIILGTAAYMSPQQARGQLLDKRTDIWAFGCVLYEMLTGQRAFGGATSSDSLAATLERQPDWTTLPAMIPRNIGQLIQRCLEKDLKHRLRDIGDARLEIDAALKTQVSGDSTGPALRTPRRALPWAVAGTLGAALAAALLLGTASRHDAASAPLRLSAELGTDASLVTGQLGQGTAAILSPDGTALAFVGQKGAGGRPQLYVRYLDQLQASALSGTDGALNPFFSPDGQWIAFFAAGKLKKIPVTGGGVLTLCDAYSNRGGDWAEDGTIAFSPDRESASLLRVSSNGGTAAPLTTLDQGEVTERWPQMLPGGKAVLYTGHNSPNGFEDANVVVQPLPTGTRKILVRGAYGGRYLTSGHLLYIRDATLFAVPFDRDRLELTGQAVRALEGVTANAPVGAAQFAVSSTGTLVYVPGQRVSFDATIHWMNREGKTTPLPVAPAYWTDLHFAPDGRRLALATFDGKRYNVWVYEWARDALSRLSLDSDDRNPVWTPDGRRIVFLSRRADKSTGNLYWQRADGAGEVQRLTESKNQQYPASWHPSGKFLAFAERHAQTNNDLMILPLEGDEASGWKPGKPTVFLNSPFSEFEPMFSPDGRWIAYQSNESGRAEVYVRPFPGPGAKSQVSFGGGAYPTWSRTRQELFFGARDHRIMVASYSVDVDLFRAERPRLWSEGRFESVDGRNFDLHPDGDRLALTRFPDAQTDEAKHHVTLIFNFFDELRRIAPAARR